MDSNFNFYVQLELNFVNKFSVTWNLFVIIDILESIVHVDRELIVFVLGCFNIQINRFNRAKRIAYVECWILVFSRPLYSPSSIATTKRSLILK